MLSFITPPVAIAAFAAATLTNADPMRTGFAAMRFGWLAFVIPFMFVLSPTLIMKGHPLLIIVDLITALAGTWLVSVGMIGYLFRPLSIKRRMITMAAGIALIAPTTGFEAGILSNLLGLAVGIAFIGWEIILRRRIQPA
jgi:TRAP-type uncharacterized transport system fused permease subunit